jgi:tungstate transport system substrate-binding protein
VKKIWCHISITLILLGLLTGCSPATPAPAAPTDVPVSPTDVPAADRPEPSEADRLILATTTSTENSGLLGYLLPGFEEEYGVEVDVVAVGTGQAIALGEDGNADVLLVHARALEDAFIEADHGVRREDVMYNDFIIVGSEADPAGIGGMTNLHLPGR